MKVLVVLLLIALALADSCGGNCPSGKCPTCYCGTTKNNQDIATWCAKYSWNQACCKCIVSHESGGNAHALNYNTNASTDVGLWQINTVYFMVYRLTGDNAIQEVLHAIQLKILIAQSRFMDGEEIPGDFGVHTPPVDVDLNPQSIIKKFQLNINLLYAK